MMDLPIVEASDQPAWRRWLEANHGSPDGAWLKFAKKGAPAKTVTYPEAVEEALCFGWIDGGGRKGMQLFAPRNARSGWSRRNKERLERLADRLEAPGRAAIERAKANGAWTLLDDAEEEIEPPELAAALGGAAREQWDAFPPSARRTMLGWLAAARRPETRAKRVEAIASCAARGERAYP
jgi:uncharacterized protein YdeI (YjbR/CyaY-like superfamily)